MSSVYRTILIQCVVGITVVSDDDYFIIVSLSRFYSVLHTFVDSNDCLFDSWVDTSVTYHVTVSIVHYDEVELLSTDSFYQLILHFVSAHFRLQVVSSYLWRRNEDTFFVIVRSFTTTVEEEGYVSVLFSFSDVELSLAVSSEVFAQSILNVFLVEEDVNTLERCIVRSHAVELQVLDSHHALFRHIFLSQYDSQFLRTVVTVVEEDHYVAFLDSTVYSRIVDWLDEFVSYTFIVRFLHSLYHVSSILTLTCYQEVVSFLHTFPTLVAVHGIETAYDRSDSTSALSAVSSQLFDEALTALRVSITTVHEAVDECTFAYTVFLSDIAKLEQVIERTVYTTV